MKQIYKKLQSKNIAIHHVAEVGVYIPETSNVIDFINDGIRTTLVEADPDVNEKIKIYFQGKNFRLYPFAMWNYEGTIKLSRAASSTFVTELPSSPAIVNDKFVKTDEQSFEVPCCRFSKIDDGTIDLLSIDIEGSEWYVLQYMTSQPKILSIETHGKYYTNPFMQEINNWILKNNYIIWYKDGSDTVYIPNGIFKPSLADRIETNIAEMKISWKKLKGIFKGNYASQK